MKTLTLRIPVQDFQLLQAEAGKLQIQPGTLARILLRASIQDMQQPSSQASQSLGLHSVLSKVP